MPGPDPDNTGRRTRPRNPRTLAWLHGEAPLARVGIVGVVMFAGVTGALAGLLLTVLDLPPAMVLALSTCGIGLTWIAETVHAGTGPVAAALRLIGLPVATIGGWPLAMWLTDLVSSGWSLVVAVAVAAVAGGAGELLRTPLTRSWGRLAAERILLGPALLIIAMVLMTLTATTSGAS